MAAEVAMTADLELSQGGDITAVLISVAGSCSRSAAPSSPNNDVANGRQGQPCQSGRTVTSWPGRTRSPKFLPIRLQLPSSG